jgi:hypothetical protein
MTSLAKNTVPFSSSYNVHPSSMLSSIRMSEGCNVSQCEYLQMVINSWTNTLTSTAVRADDVGPKVDSDTSKNKNEVKIR